MNETQCVNPFQHHFCRADKLQRRSTEDDHTYTIERDNGVNGKLAPGESVLLKELLVKNIQKLDNQDHGHIKKALKVPEKPLRNNYERIYFNSNLGAFLIGIVVS